MEWRLWPEKVSAASASICKVSAKQAKSLVTNGSKAWQRSYTIARDDRTSTSSPTTAAQSPPNFLAANPPQSVEADARCEQHLYHYNHLLSRHVDRMREAPCNHALDDPKQVVCMAYRGMSQGTHPVSTEELRSSVQEFSYPGIDRAVVRYLSSSTTEHETKHRRSTQLAQWKCPVVLGFAATSPTQPWEFLEGAEK